MNHDQVTPYVRNALNVKRFSNKLGGEVVEVYVDAAQEILREFENYEGKTEQQLARLLAQADQIEKTIATKYSRKYGEVRKQLRDLINNQSKFFASQLVKQTEGVGVNVNTVEVSRDYVEALVAGNPSAKLEMEGGEVIRRSLPQIMPDGEPSLNKAIEDLSKSSSDNLINTLRRDLLLGKTPNEIVKGLLKGNKIPKGSPLKKTERAIRNVVQSAVIGTSAEAQKLTISANKDITTKYEFLATLDSRTTPQCQVQDGKVYEYDDPTAPTPPLHFGCRSTVVPYLGDFYKENGIEPPDSTRASKGVEGGQQVSTDLNYEDWLRTQPREFQESVLGKGKTQLFQDGMSLSDFVREDGSKKTLEEIAIENNPPEDSDMTEEDLIGEDEEMEENEVDGEDEAEEYPEIEFDEFFSAYMVAGDLRLERKKAIETVTFEGDEISYRVENNNNPSLVENLFEDDMSVATDGMTLEAKKFLEGKPEKELINLRGIEDMKVNVDAIQQYARTRGISNVSIENKNDTSNLSEEEQLKITLEARKIFKEKVIPSLQEGQIISSTPNGSYNGLNAKMYEKAGFSKVDVFGQQYAIVRNGKLEPLPFFPPAEEYRKNGISLGEFREKTQYDFSNSPTKKITEADKTQKKGSGENKILGIVEAIEEATRVPFGRKESFEEERINGSKIYYNLAKNLQTSGLSALQESASSDPEDTIDEIKMDLKLAWTNTPERKLLASPSTIYKDLKVNFGNFQEYAKKGSTTIVSWFEKEDVDLTDDKDKLKAVLEARRMFKTEVLPTLKEGDILNNSPLGGVNGSRAKMYEKAGFSKVDVFGQQYAIVRNGKLEPLQIFSNAEDFKKKNVSEKKWKDETSYN